MSEALSQDGLTLEGLYRIAEDDGLKHELEAGCLVSEPPPGARHGYAAARMCRLLATHVDERGLGAVFGNDTGYLLARAPDTLRGPDVSFVTRERLVRVELPRGPFPGAPDLAVEILSSSNTPARIRAKVADYLAAGTRLVWVVDPDSKTVKVYRSLLAPRVLGETDALDGEEVVPGLHIAVAELFWSDR
jgi:Uma2 family endonuclease